MRYVSLGVKHSDGRIERGAAGTGSAASVASSPGAQRYSGCSVARYLFVSNALGSLGTHLWAALVKVLWIAVAE